MDDAYNILLVEDSATDAEMLIRSMGCVMNGDCLLHRAGNMTEAESRLKGDTHYDIVLLDLGLPDTEDRIDTFVRMKMVNHDDIPVLILSSVDHHRLALGMVNAGAENYLTKAEAIRDPEYLRDAIDFAICRHRTQGKVKAYKERAAGEAGDKDEKVRCA